MTNEADKEKFLEIVPVLVALAQVAHDIEVPSQDLPSNEELEEIYLTYLELGQRYAQDQRATRVVRVAIDAVAAVRYAVDVINSDES